MTHPARVAAAGQCQPRHCRVGSRSLASPARGFEMPKSGTCRCSSRGEPRTVVMRPTPTGRAAAQAFEASKAESQVAVHAHWRPRGNDREGVHAHAVDRFSPGRPGACGGQGTTNIRSPKPLGTLEAMPTVSRQGLRERQVTGAPVLEPELESLDAIAEHEQPPDRRLDQPSRLVVTRLPSGVIHRSAAATAGAGTPGVPDDLKPARRAFAQERSPMDLDLAPPTLPQSRESQRW